MSMQTYRKPVLALSLRVRSGCQLKLVLAMRGGPIHANRSENIIARGDVMCTVIL